jgi:hypothetical protein
MKLINREWNAYLGKYQNMWLADDESQIGAESDPDGAEGSTIIVIATEEMYMKNSQGRWQKCGSTEVIV